LLENDAGLYTLINGLKVLAVKVVTIFTAGVAGMQLVSDGKSGR